MVRGSAGDDRDRVRKQLVDLFDLFPADDPRVVKARRNLASALF
jgi:putative thioredoxin